MIRNLRHVLKSLADSRTTRINSFNGRVLLSNSRACVNVNFLRTKKDDSSKLFKPVEIKHEQDDIDVGAEITGGPIDKSALLKILNKFSQKKETRLMCMENAMDSELLILRKIWLP